MGARRICECGLPINSENYGHHKKSKRHLAGLEKIKLKNERGGQLRYLVKCLCGFIYRFSKAN
jgi:hypothetical protein